MVKQAGGVNKVRVAARHAANKYSRSEAEKYVRGLLSIHSAFFGSEVDRLTFEYLCERIGVEIEWVRHDLNEGLTLSVKGEKGGKKGPAKRESTGEESGQGDFWEEDN